MTKTEVTLVQILDFLARRASRRKLPAPRRDQRVADWIGNGDDAVVEEKALEAFIEKELLCSMRLKPLQTLTFEELSHKLL